MSLCVAAVAAVALAGGISSAAAVTFTLHSGNPGSPPNLDALVNVLAPVTPATPAPPRPANIVAPYPGWGGPLTGSNWVSVAANYVGSSSTMTESFTLPPNALASGLSVTMLADNQAAVTLNGNPSPFGSQPVSCTSTANFHTPASTFTTSGPFVAGVNTLSFAVNNCPQTPTGLDYTVVGHYDLLDHFKCYTVQGQRPPIVSRPMVVRDQFGAQKVVAREERQICNPVKKTHGRLTASIVNPQAHLVCYRTDGSSGAPVHAVRLRNQFGIVDTRTTGAQTLCVPSLKRIVRGRPIVPTGANPENVLDHFRCYGVEPRKAVQAVTLRDQFARTDTRVFELVRLCNPVEKRFNGRITKITRPQAHLACYVIRDAQPFSGRTVVVRNQFGIRRLRVLRVETLCVPTYKQDLAAGPIPTPTPTPIPTPTPTPTPTPVPTLPVGCDLKITKTMGPTPLVYGQSATVTLAVANVGDGPCAPGPAAGTIVRDNQPVGLTLGGLLDQTGWSCSQEVPSGNATCGNQTVLPVGYTATLTMKDSQVTAAAGSSVTNCAQISNPNDTNKANNESCVTVAVR